MTDTLVEIQVYEVKKDKNGNLISSTLVRVERPNDPVWLEEQDLKDFDLDEMDSEILMNHVRMDKDKLIDHKRRCGYLK